jgi:hypothetical protein
LAYLREHARSDRRNDATADRLIRGDTRGGGPAVCYAATMRRIIRCCESGLLEAITAPGAAGAEWLVSPQSPPRQVAHVRAPRKTALAEERQDPSLPLPASTGRININERASSLVPQLPKKKFYSAPSAARPCARAARDGSIACAALSRCREECPSQTRPAGKGTWRSPGDLRRDPSELVRASSLLVRDSRNSNKEVHDE